MFKTTLTDVVIPLGSGSRYDDLELRIALRSIARHVKDCGKVWVISSSPPEWLRNCRLLNVPDRYCHNKDANIISKLLRAACEADLSNKFLFWSDDQAALKNFNASALPPVYNPRDRGNFNKNTIWHRRMQNTFEYLAQRGITLSCNWESHTPQLLDKKRFYELIAPVDYISEPGYAVNTLYFGLAGSPWQIPQSLVKLTVESAVKIYSLPENKLFIGYNDQGLRGDLKQLLQNKFPDPCIYEQT